MNDDLKLPGEDDRKKQGVSSGRMMIWLVVGGIGLYLVLSGVIGILTKAS